MSGLYQLRKEIRTLLLQDGLWSNDEVIIKRRTNLWNTVATAIGASEAGQCIVVGVAKGSPHSTQRKGSKNLIMEVTIPITLVELPGVDPEEYQAPDGSDEDSRWEDTVMRLLGEPLGRSAETYELDFDGFEDLVDEEYVIRQTTFKTKLMLKPR